ncbi:DUF1428 family protein [Halomonas sp. HK25]|uniref:DUF1428 family protein n=1 Tax=Halomonas sp. HK25 TaxID=3394321 RepID=UPI0039FD21AA
MNYVDGFVAAVPTANREKYIQHARDAALVFKEHGALHFSPMPFDGKRLIYGGFEVVVDES